MKKLINKSNNKYKIKLLKEIKQSFQENKAHRPKEVHRKKKKRRRRKKKKEEEERRI